MATANYITCLTSLILIVIAVYILAAKNKTALHYSFLACVSTVFIWTVAVTLQSILSSSASYYVLFENITYFGSAFAPVSLIFLAQAYAKPDKPLNNKHFLLGIVPLITLIMVWTNEYHHLFFIQYGIANSPIILGTYFYFHAVYSFICLFFGLAWLSYFAVKNSGITSIKAVLILIGSIIPAVVNVLYTIGMPGLDVFSTPITFAATLAMYLLAMFRFNLLKVAPIALQAVINRISDSFVVVDISLNIIDYNKTFADNFQYIPGLHKGDNFNRILNKWHCNNLGADEFRGLITSAAKSYMTQQNDIEIDFEGARQYFTVEFTPIIQRNTCVAVILLFKNITQHVKDVEKIQENQTILLERERLASLGQLIGGIAHNLKTPIMSVAGGIDQLAYLAEEYEASVDDKQVTREDHLEIAAEMQQWLAKMKTHLSYMSDIISTVKDQATQFNTPGRSWFTLGEMLKRVNILMQHELVKNNCKYKQDVRVKQKQRIDGDINSLVQILDNIIVNAIQAYGESGGEIILKVVKEGNSLLISVSDFGPGVEPKIKDRLFKEMITTKGKHGTGLGLYMSYSTIKGVFRGNMWFESAKDTGTKFYIQLPLPEELTEGQQYA